MIQPHTEKQLANGWLQVWDAIHHAHFYVNDVAGASHD